MPEEQKQFDEILKGLEELKRKKPKDVWDKLGILVQLVSGVFLVLLGFYITFSLNAAQQNVAQKISDSQNQSAKEIVAQQLASSQQNADAQLKSADKIAEAQIKSSEKNGETQALNSRDIATSQIAFQGIVERLNHETTNRNIASDYLGKLTATTGANDRAALLNAMDVTLEPRYSVPLALRLTQPVQVRTDICRGVQIDDESARQQAVVSSMAVDLLKRMKTDQPGRLRRIVNKHQEPDTSIASAVLRGDSPFQFRLTQIDDVADVFINSDKNLGRFDYGFETGWLTVREENIPRSNFTFSVHVGNGAAGGSGIRVELRVGVEQVDRLVIRHEQTKPGVGFWVQFGISRDSEGNYHLNGDSLNIDSQLGTIPQFRCREET